MTAAGIYTLDGLVGLSFRCIVADPPRAPVRCRTWLGVLDYGNV